jgi:predicted transcriptional regulator
MTQEMLVTHMHNHGFGFGCVWNAEGQPEQCFIPAPLAANLNLAAGDKINCIVSPNFADKSEGTPWQVIKLLPQDDILASGQITTVKPEDVITMARDALDYQVLEFILTCGYATATEIAAAVGVERQAASNSAQRHFNANKIARAAVYHRADQTRPSFVLYASEANDFLETT